MWSQLIFFFAVALVIILLVRRSRSNDQVAARLMGGLRALGGGVASAARSIGGAVSGVGGRLRQRTERARTKGATSALGSIWPNSRRDTANDTRPVSKPSKGGSNLGSYAFWDEESPSSRIEISSHFEEAERLLKEGKATEAEQLFLKAATANPGDPKIYARLGLLYLQQKNYSDAIESLKVAVKLDKYNPSRHYNLSLAYWGNKDEQKAIASVREAITLDPVTQKYRQLLEQLLNG